MKVRKFNSGAVIPPRKSPASFIVLASLPHPHPTRYKV